MAADLFEDLLHRYAEPQRHYHDTRHLAEVMEVIDEFEAHAGDIEAVRLAAWFHDAVYDPTRTDNEERSALLATTQLSRLGLPAPQVAEVARLVRLTRAHDPGPGDRNGELLCDADLSILGAAPDRYAEYVAGIRREHAHVDAAGFAAGRGVVLRGLLSHSPLFRTTGAHARWEQAARANINEELATLRTPGS